jgi:hypothetical protein
MHMRMSRRVPTTQLPGQPSAPRGMRPPGAPIFEVELGKGRLVKLSDDDRSAE